MMQLSFNNPLARSLWISMGISVGVLLVMNMAPSAMAQDMPPDAVIKEMMEDQFYCDFDLPALMVGANFADDRGFSSGGSVTLGVETVSGPINAGGSATLTGTTVNGPVNAGGRVDAKEVTIHGNLNAGGRLEATHAKFHANVNAGGRAELDHTTVDGNLNVGGLPQIENSEIHGTLSTAADNVTLVNSKVKNIRITNSGVQVSSSTINNNNVITTRTVVSHSNSHVSVGPGSVSNINGFKVTASPTETTVITRDGAIYVNGQKVHGEGPSSYAELRAQKPESPTIQGPGWQEGLVAPKSASKGTQQPATAPTHIVRLTGNTEVTGDVVFDNGQGKLIIEKGAVFTGHIEGGTVERL